MWTIYTYWNSASVIQALNAIVIVMGGADWLGLMQTMALIGLLVAASIGLLKISFKEPGQYIIMLMILYSVLFVPKITVSVQDVRSGAVGTVANVPLGVAFISSVTSHIGKFLTETTETAFGASDELQFSKTGMGWAAGAMKQLADVRPRNPKAQEAFANFTRACIIPEIIDDASKYQALTNATNILTTIAAGRGTAAGWINPGRVVSMPNSGSAGYTVMPCITVAVGGNAYDEVTTWLTAEVTSQQSWIARNLLPDAAPATANTLIATYLPGVEGALLGSSRSITEQIMQAMTVNLMNESAGSLALVQNDPAAVQLAVGTATAVSSATSAYRVMGMIGAEALPKFRNMVEIMMISVFPIVLLVIILAGDRGGTALKTYVMTAVWVQLWAPLYAIINNMLTPVTAARFQAQMGGTVTQTMSNASSMLQTGFSEQAMAGALVIAVPVIAYALVRGGEVAMSSAMNMLSSPASGSADRQGSSVGLGNVQMGNTAWGSHSSNSMSANKWDDNSSISQGKIHASNDMSQMDYGMRTGGSRISGAGAVSDLGEYGVMAKAAMAHTASTGYQNNWQNAQEQAGAFNNQVQSAWSNFLKNNAASSTGNSVRTSGGSGSDSTSSAAVGRGMDMVNDFAKRHHIGSGEAMAAIISASATAGAGTGGMPGPAFNMSMGGRMDGRVSAETQKAWDEGQKIGQSSDFKALTQAVDRSSVSTEGSRSSEARTGAESGRDSTLSGAVSHLQQAREAFSKSQQFQQALQATQGIDGSGQHNLANQVVRELGGANAAMQAIRSGNQTRIEGAISRVVKREMARQMNMGTMGADGSSSPSLPTTEGTRLQQNVEERTLGVTGQVETGTANVKQDATAHRGGLSRPTSTATLDGQTASGVMGQAGGAVAGQRQAVNSGAVKLQERGGEVSSDVQAQTAAMEAGGALPAMVTRNAIDAVESTGRNVVRAGKELGNAVISMEAGKIANNMGWKGQQQEPAAEKYPDRTASGSFPQ